MIPAAIEEIDRRAFRILFDNHSPLSNRPHIIRKANGSWVGGNGYDGIFCDDRNEAHIFQTYGLSPSGQMEAGTICEILPDEPTPTEVVDVLRGAAESAAPKVNLVKKLFTPDFIRMMEAAPKNEMVRGWILKTTKQLPPEDCDSLEKIEEWLQSIQKSSPTPLKAVGRSEGFSITLDFHGSESGKARYTVDTAGSDEFKFSDDELRKMAAESDGDFDSMFEYAAETISDETFERTDALLEAVGDYNYTDHECTDSGDAEYDYNRGNLKTQLRNWLAANMPEEWARMNG